MNYSKLFIAIIIFCSTGISYAQKIENIESVFNKDRVTVYYDLIGSVEGQKFDVKLYSSNSKSPLNYVSGDVGKNVQAGKRKYIEYLIVKDFPSFDGELTFEVRGTLVFTPLSLINFTKDTTIRRGTIPKLKWHGGSLSSNFKVELLQKGVATGILKEDPSRTAAWNIPVSTPLGSQYQLKVIDQTTNTLVLSKQITIKRKIPLVISIGIPLVLVGGGTAAIIALTGKSSSSSNNSSSSQSSGLPSAPDHPTGP